MRLRVSLELYSAAFLTALGFGAGCGGSFESDDGTGNQTGSGGAISTGGGNSGGQSTGGSSGSGGSAGNAFPCHNPQPIVRADGTETGYVQCDGFIHRPQIGTCGSLLPREGTTCDIALSICTMDSECNEFAHGHCSTGQSGLSEPGCFCNYGCVSDAECAQGQICLCGDPVGRCVTALCQSDADCGAGFLCKSYVENPGCGGTAFACQTPSDQCGADADCLSGQQCTRDFTTGVQHCEGPSCVIGRPFLVAGSERVASATSRNDWRSEIVPEVHGLSIETRTRLAEHWTKVGLMEHASIAAFARFALELLALGAPPELVQATQRAMAEETEHARASFALASVYAARPIGPGRLAIDRALDDSSLAGIALTTIEEGCIGETVAAVEAAEAAAHAKDPVVRVLLEQIASDERRHALLAWEFLRWALSQADRALRARIERRFLELGKQKSIPEPGHEDELLTHGVMSDRRRAELRALVIERVVLPCFSALAAHPAQAAA